MVVTDPEANVTAEHLKYLLKAGEQKDIDNLTLSTDTGITDTLREATERHDIDLLSPETVSGGSETDFRIDADEISMPITGEDTDPEPRSKPTDTIAGDVSQDGGPSPNSPPNPEKDVKDGNGKQINEKESSSSKTNYTRFVAVGGGLLAGASLFMPWAVATQDIHSWDGMATEMSTVILIGVFVTVVFPAVSWGGGWGRLSTLTTGVAGLALGFLGFVTRDTLNESVATGHMKLDGQEIPIAALESGSGLDVLLLASVLIVLGSVAGLLFSFK